MKGNPTSKAALEKKGTSLEKKDMATDKKQNIKENSKADLSKDAMIQRLMAAKGMK